MKGVMENDVTPVVSLVCGILFTGVYIILYRPDFIIIIASRMAVWRCGGRYKVLRDRSGTEFSYIERSGRGPCSVSVLLLHGFSSSADTFCAVIEKLPSNWNVVALDLPGHGNTPIPGNDACAFGTEFCVLKVKEFVDCMGLSKVGFHMVGHSFGGMVSLAYSSQYPEDVRSLVTLAPAGVLFDKQAELLKQTRDDVTKLASPESLEDARKIFSVLYNSFAEPAEFLLRGALMLAKRRSEFNKIGPTDDGSVVVDTDEACTSTKTCKGFFNFEVISKLLDEILSGSVLELCKGIRTRVLIVWGEQDRCVLAEGAHVLRSRLQGTAECHILPSIGHGLCAEADGQVAGLIQAFVSRAPPLATGVLAAVC